MHWYDHVRRPIVEVMHHEDMLRLFPGCAEADPVAWIIRCQARLRQWYGGRDIPTEELAEEATQVTEDTMHLFLGQGGRQALRFFGAYSTNFHSHNVTLLISVNDSII